MVTKNWPAEIVAKLEIHERLLAYKNVVACGAWTFRTTIMLAGFDLSFGGLVRGVTLFSWQAWVFLGSWA